MNNDHLDLPAPGSRSPHWLEVHRRLGRLRESLASEGLPSPAEQARILRERAEALARPPAEALAEAPIEFVAFALADECYGIESIYLREVVGVQELTPLPGVPAFISGIFNLRGCIVSVLDLKRFLGLPQKGLSDFHTVVVIHSASMEFGLLADRVLGARQVLPSQLQTAPPTLSGVGRQCLKGITPDRLALLDGARLLADPRVVVHEEV